MIVPSEDFVTPWSHFGHYGLTHVRIWFRRTPFGVFQRHEWRGEDGSLNLDRWILSSGKSVPPNTEVAQAEDDESDLIKVLEQIAAGHNDARALAAKALAKMRDKTTQKHT